MGKLDPDILVLCIVIAIVVLALKRNRREGMAEPAAAPATTAPPTVAPVAPEPYDASNVCVKSSMLSAENAETIALLKKKILDADTRSDRLEQNISLMQSQIDGLLEQQTQFAQDIAGSEPATISGLDSA